MTYRRPAGKARPYESTSVLARARPSVHVGEWILHKIGRATVTLQMTSNGSFINVYWLDQMIATSKAHVGPHGTYRDSALATVRHACWKMRLTRVQRVDQIIAYRGWDVMGDQLQSVTQKRPNEWLGPVNNADVDPFESSDGGLYCVKMTHIEEMLRSYQPAVHGIVELYGHVIEHEQGYRAQRMVIRRLNLTWAASDGYVKVLGDRYQCDVKIVIPSPHLLTWRV